MQHKLDGVGPIDNRPSHTLQSVGIVGWHPSFRFAPGASDLPLPFQIWLSCNTETMA